MGQREEVNIKEILRASRMGMWRVEMEEGKPPRFYADEVMDELLGIDREITPEERFVFHRLRIHPEDMQLFQEYSDKLTEVRTEIVYRYIHPVSGAMFVRCGGARDTSVTEYVAVTGIHQDISETVRIEKEKEAERRLAELNDSLRKEKRRQDIYYKELLDIENCGVLAYTMPGHKVIHMNAEALRMYGIESVEAAQRELGPLLRQVYYPDSEVLNQLKKLRNEDDMVDYECIIGKGKANECHALAKTKVVHIPTGERAVLTTFVDVSDMVMLKNALRRAEEGSRAKSSFLFAMSHDLRTPLTSIIGTTSSLLSDDSILSDAEKRELLENIENDSSWLLNMVENLLSVTRINDTVTHQVNKTPEIVEEVVAEAVQRLKKRFPSASIIVHVPTDYLLIPMDAILIEQVLINLLENALIHSGSSHSPELTVTDHPDHVTFCVKDFGHGLNPDVIPDIFSGICHNTGSVDSHKGMGIGLSICKTIIDAHNGYIEAKNHTNGALFLFTLPKEEEENIPCSQK